jgi:hypothetical protein
MIQVTTDDQHALARDGSRSLCWGARIAARSCTGNAAAAEPIDHDAGFANRRHCPSKDGCKSQEHDWASNGSDIDLQPAMRNGDATC